MRKFITLIFFQIYVDVLGFPVYLKHVLEEYENKSFIKNKKKVYKITQTLIK